MAKTTVKSKLVRIGNSRGVRIPKPLIEQAGIKENVEIIAREGELIIKSATKPRKPREGWREAFRKAGSRQDKPLFDGGAVPNKFDDEEWTW